MESSPSPKFGYRSSRDRLPEPLSKAQKRQLGRLFDQSQAESNLSWNPSRNNPDIINIKRLNYPKQQVKNRSALDDHIVINVCGDRYETHRTTLELYPNTLLGNEKYRKYYYDEIRKEYFFDRHRACFEAILYYYQSHGRLRRPDFVPIDIFLEEVTFFQLGHHALNQIYSDENLKEIKKTRLPKNRIRRYLWATIEYPAYSLTAKIYNIISLMMALLSAIAIAVESMPEYSDLNGTNCQNQSNTTMPNLMNITTNQTTYQTVTSCPSYFVSPFFIIQGICVGFFTIEISIRILTTPSLLDYIKHPMNWVDIIAVIPFYVRIGIHYAGHNALLDSQSYAIIRPLRILRVARVFRFCQLFKSVKSLRALITTIRQSLLDFFIMITILSLIAFLLGAAAYYAENDANPVNFDSMFSATYWGVITITSVGYGDLAPVTPIGRIIACLCALLGAATIAMLVSVLVGRYQRVYAQTLYINSEQIDFSDDESDDTNSHNLNQFNGHRRNSRIEDPDARAKELAINGSTLTELTETQDSRLEEEENTTDRNINRIHFIIGYVDNEKQETTRALVKQLSHVAEEKDTSEDDVSLDTLSTGNKQESSSHNDDGIVIKTFKFPASSTDDH